MTTLLSRPDVVQNLTSIEQCEIHLITCNTSRAFVSKISVAIHFEILRKFNSSPSLGDLNKGTSANLETPFLPYSSHVMYDIEYFDSDSLSCFVNSIFLPIYTHTLQDDPNTKLTSPKPKSHFLSIYICYRARVSIMNKMISGVAAAAATGESFRGTVRSMPKRGHVKSRMASNAFHSIASVLSKASSQIHHTKKAI
ncbi:hypothetical protein RHMOL_Rhmol07G0105900 [Rhododendron molle]|uniref:Uncharacterized protein n=1 Tax=Rhododendron molle TaxID=49168 RepID=A0ACC0N0D8_RHOML|nr:hypothetical protein RHMOL_Rhmol07G0105900 [Rhododendron molle]